MCKISILFVVVGLAVSAQGFPYRPNDLATAIAQQNFDQLHALMGDFNRQQYGLTPVSNIQAPQRVVFVSGQQTPGLNSIGSGFTSVMTSHTGPDGKTIVQRSGEGFVANNDKLTHFKF